MERKICEVPEFKLGEEGNGSFQGWASKFGAVDRVGDIVVKGAFEKTLPQFKEHGFIAVGHAWDALPVATIGVAREESAGLFISGDFHSTAAAQQARTVVRERLERGKSVGLSIGYQTKQEEMTAAGRLLKEVALYEVSLVTVPCCQEALATSAKALQTAVGALLDPDAVPDASSSIQADNNSPSPGGQPFSRSKEQMIADADRQIALYKAQAPEKSDAFAGWSEAYWHLLKGIHDGLAENRGPEAVESLLDEFADNCIRLYTGLKSTNDPEAGAALKAALEHSLDTRILPVRAPYEAELDAVLVAAESCKERGEEIARIRAEKGRPFSPARAEQIARLATVLKEFADAPAPVPQLEPDDILRQRARVLAVMAQQRELQMR